MVERYYPTFASLRDSQKFMTLRATIGLDAFSRCFDRFDRAELLRCRDWLDRFVHTAPMSAELARDAGALVVHKLNHANAAPFFAMAFEAPHGELVCAAPGLAKAVLAGLDTPGQWLEGKSAIALADRCWPNLQREIEAEIAHETSDSFYIDNSCLLLMKHDPAAGQHIARCRAPAKTTP
jgi:hypothetical protein